MNPPRILDAVLSVLLVGAGFTAARGVSDDLANGAKLRGDRTFDKPRSSVRAGVASDDLVNGVKLRGDSRPVVADDIGLGETLGAKLAKLDRQRARREAQLAGALAGLAADDPKRAAIIARFERKFAQLDAKRARLEAQGADAGADTARRVDRRAVRHADRPERLARGGRAERPDRTPRPGPTERVERSGKTN